MGLNRLALAALAAACIGAAGVGGYFATRQNVASMAAPEAAAASAVPNPRPVQETEASVSPAASPTSVASDAPVAPVSTSTAVATSAPVNRRTESASPTRPAAPTPKQMAAKSRQTEPPTLDRSWPSGSTSQLPPSASQADTQPTPPVTHA